jgi:hypothetical protein
MNRHPRRNRYFNPWQNSGTGTIGISARVVDQRIASITALSYRTEALLALTRVIIQ